MLNSRSDPQAGGFLAAEVAAESVRLAHRRRELARHRGVAWSGMAPDRAEPQSPHALKQKAKAQRAAQAQWDASPDGRFLSALAACQAAAQGAHALGERARAGAARGEPCPWRRRILLEMSVQARALAAGLRQARRALDVADDQ